MQIQNEFTKITGVSYPIIMAPMFLVTNLEMMKAALDSGIIGVFPTLNFRKDGEIESILDALSSYKNSKKITDGSYGVNLIVQKTNILYQKHLEICVQKKVPFYITSLGNPKEVIERAHSYGAKVFCDVTNIGHAAKAASVGCDGFIAVGQGAGGHAGPYPLSILIPSLKKEFPNLPVVAAGGVANGTSMLSMLAAGASAVSIGTLFIASTEATVDAAYKNAVVQSGMEDIVMTERISGTPCAIINTPYAKKIGLKQNAFERFLNSNSTTKKWFKMLVQIRSMKKLEQAIKPGNYHNLWCAGQSVELINDIKPCREIVSRLINELEIAHQDLNKSFIN